HRQEEPLPVEQINPKIPPRFARLVRRMMAKKPDDRFPNAHAIRQELHAWANGEPVRPLDKPGDTQYEQAVHELEVAEPSKELIEESISVGEPAPVGTAVLIEEELPVSKPAASEAHRPTSRRSAPRLRAVLPADASSKDRPLSLPGLVAVMAGILVIAIALFI